MFWGLYVRIVFGIVEFEMFIKYLSIDIRYVIEFDVEVQGYIRIRGINLKVINKRWYLVFLDFE